MAVLRCGRFSVPLDRPLLMGVVNVTPDSFSDGGRFFDPALAIAHAFQLVEDGADLVDVGGESTRPGALPVSVQQEMDRVLPVLEGLKAIQKPISVDTRRPEVMQAALGAGASMINDVQALQAPGALEAVAGSACAVCLMHMKGEPATMQRSPHYDDVLAEVLGFLKDRALACEKAGISRERIVVDPGFGFGKTLEHNLALMNSLSRFGELGLPVLAGWSRKSSLGRITGRTAPAERLSASLAMALLALQGGARILRVHDVRETRDIVRVWEAYEGMTRHDAQ